MVPQITKTATGTQYYYGFGRSKGIATVLMLFGIGIAVFGYFFFGEFLSFLPVTTGLMAAYVGLISLVMFLFGMLLVANSCTIIEEQLCYTLYSTSNTITQAYRGLLEPLSLTYTQFVVMMALWQKDKVSVTELAATVDLSKPTMTPLLKRLEILGYITREYEPEDERQ